MDEPGVGRFLVAMSLQGIVFIALLFLIELRCIRLLLNLCRRRKKVGEEGKIGHVLPYYWFGCYQSQSRVCVFVRLWRWQKKLFNLRTEMLPRRGREFWTASQWLSPWWAAHSFYRSSARYAVTLCYLAPNDCMLTCVPQGFNFHWSIFFCRLLMV